MSGALILSLEVSHAAMDANPPEPFQKQGTLPPKDADSSYLHSKQQKKYFLVIAVNTTDVPKTELTFAQVDGYRIVEALTALGYQPLLQADPILTGENATATRIMALLKEAQKKEDNATIVVYYSGHGAAGSKDLWLQTAGQVEVGDGQGLKVSDLIIKIRQTPGGNGFEGELVLIIDACYSGQGTLSKALTLNDLGSKTTIFTSSNEIQESFSLSPPLVSKQISAFTHTLLQGFGSDWAQADSDGNGRLHWFELEQYVTNQLARLSERGALKQPMKPSVVTNHIAGFLAFRQDMVRLFPTSHFEQPKIPKDLQLLGTGSKDIPTSPQETQLLAARSELTPEDSYDHGVAAAAQGELEKARALLTKAREDSQKREKSLQHAILLAQARLELYAANYIEALTLYQQAERHSPPTTPELFNEMGFASLKAGKHSEAESYLVQAVRQGEQTFATDNFVMSTSLNNLATLYQAQGKYTDAEPLYRRALAIKEQILGPDHLDTASSLISLAELYRAQGNYIEAVPLYQRALAIRDHIHGPDHLDTASSLNNLGLLYQAQGKYTDAEPLYQRALAIREQILGPEHPEIVSSLNNLALLYQAQGKYTDAEPLYQRALAIREQILGPEHSEIVSSLISLAELYRTQGNYTLAEPLYQRALTIREQTLGVDHPDIASSLNSLAEIYWSQGHYDKAEPLYHRALAIREQILGPKHPGTASSLDGLSLLYQAIGYVDRAEPLSQRALAIREKVLGPEHPDTASSLNNLAFLYQAQGNYSEAMPLSQRALAIREKVLGPEHPDTVSSLNNLALLYQAVGYYDRAEPLYQRALAIREQLLGPDHPDTARSQSNLALLHQDQGKYDVAESRYRKALAIQEKVLGPKHPDTGTTQYNLAWLMWNQDRWVDALYWFERAVEIEDVRASQFLMQGNEARKRAYMALIERSTQKVMSFAVAAVPNIPAASNLGLNLALKWKGRLLDVLASSTRNLRTSLDSKNQSLLESYQAKATVLSNFYYKKPDQLPDDQYHARLTELQEELALLETEISSRSANFRAQPNPVTIQQIQQEISPDTKLLEWVRYQPFNPKATRSETQWGAPRYAVYILKSTGTPFLVDVGEAQSIESLIHDFQAALTDPQARYYRELAFEIFKRLMEPLSSHIGNAKHLLISPVGSLNLLPFGALQDKTGHALIDQYQLTYLTSGRDLLRPGNVPRTPQPMLVLADPDFGSPEPTTATSTREQNYLTDFLRAGARFTPVPGTAAEAEALRNLLNLRADQVLMRDRATETVLKQAHGPRVLHIATQGFFLSNIGMDLNAASGFAGLAKVKGPQDLKTENPLLRSGLALAGANQRNSGRDDGILTALEAASLDLQGTELVVLSACETGVGVVDTGEGVFGLRRALLLAGARTQVVSLWKIHDQATKDLMVDYYQRLLKGEGRSEALRNAQLTMMKSKDRSHPYYWAGFVLIGDPSPLRHE